MRAGPNHAPGRTALAFRRSIDAGSVLILALACILGIVHMRGLVSSRDSTEGSVSAFEVDANAPDSLPSEVFYRLASEGQWDGPRFARVVILVYTSYGCSFSAELAGSLAILRQRYPDHLAVSVKHYDDPSSPHPVQSLVPLGAECAGEQGRFHEFHQAAFTKRSLLDYPDGVGTVAAVAGIPDLESFESCVWTRRFHGRLIAQHAEARRLQVEGTPAMYINGRKFLGAIPLQDLELLVAERFPRRSELIEARTPG